MLFFDRRNSQYVEFCHFILKKTYLPGCYWCQILLELLLVKPLSGLSGNWGWGEISTLMRCCSSKAYFVHISNGCWAVFGADEPEVWPSSHLRIKVTQTFAKVFCSFELTLIKDANCWITYSEFKMVRGFHMSGSAELDGALIMKDKFPWSLT